MIGKYAKDAVASRAVILHACGFDSVPSDLCAFLAVQQLKKIAGERVAVGRVSSAVSLKGAASGGTVDTMWTMLAGSKESKKVGANPYALSPSAPCFPTTESRRDRELTPSCSSRQAQGEPEHPHLSLIRRKEDLGRLLAQ